MADPTDDVTWNPAINSAASGASLDDRYNIPGATKIDGTVDTVNQAAGVYTRINAGATGNAPTGNGWNQVVGVINARITALNNKMGTARPTSPTFTVPPTASAVPIRIQTAILDLRSQIDWIRLQEKSTAYTWSTDFDAEGVNSFVVIKGYHLAELRKALAGKYIAFNIAESATLTPAIVQQVIFPVTQTITNMYEAVQTYTVPNTGNGILVPDPISFNNSTTTPWRARSGTSGSATTFSVFRCTAFFRFRNLPGTDPAPSHTLTQVQINPYTNTSPWKVLVPDVAGLSIANVQVYVGNTGLTSVTPTFANVFTPVETWGGTLIGTTTGSAGSVFYDAGNITSTFYYIHIRLESTVEQSQLYYDGTQHFITTSFTNLTSFTPYVYYE